MIKAQIVADSLSPNGDRLVSLLCTFPRIILAEVNTHRMLSKNTASSRAIPFKKMVESVNTNPFIPIAWQIDHKGMQGTEYLTAPIDVAYAHDEWIGAKHNAVKYASIMNENCKVTKQLANRLLEPFMWTTMLITGSLEQGWDNFFNLRCPSYKLHSGDDHKVYKSWKDAIVDYPAAKDASIIDRLKLNTGAAEIHMMALAECIWDAFNESTPKQLKAGDWHIPFEKIIDRNGKTLYKLSPYFYPDHGGIVSSEFEDALRWVIETKVKISTSMAARTSYTIVGEEKEVSIEKQVELHDNLVAQQPPHSSPMEHCALCMNSIEYATNVKGSALYKDVIGSGPIPVIESNKSLGWCRNFRGFIPYRHIIETEKQKQN